MKNKKAIPAIVVLALLAIAGIAAWIYQLANGLAVTGMNNGTSWGLYIISFMFFVGLSAGGLIVASSAAVFGVKEYKKVAKPAVLLSTVCIVAAAGFVIIDLGGVQRVFNLITHANFTSPLMWDVFVITLYLIINIIYLVLMRRPNTNERMLAITSRFALPIAILVHSVTAWIFGLQIAKLGWYSTIMAPLFVASALDSGLALLLIVLVILNATRLFETSRKLLASLAGLLVVCIAVDAFMVLSEVLTLAYPTGSEHAALAGLLLTGEAAPLFWGEVVLGVVVPFLLLVTARARQSTPLVVVASLLVLVGVYLKRAWLLLTSFAAFNIEGAPGVAFGHSALGGTDMWSLAGSYTPTWVEGLIVVGVVALAALLYVLFAPRLLAASPEETIESAAVSAATAGAATAGAPAGDMAGVSSSVGDMAVVDPLTSESAPEVVPA
ncbi:MAG: polysulfide reductase NrfD [Coriobacteriales bacterium]|jgi:molybdopterin-containing oxidoreductase family membrane subunit|nr:polysulfide reductase NrfD [Coriobacteriales bacterium]